MIKSVLPPNTPTQTATNEPTSNTSTVVSLPKRYTQDAEQNGVLVPVGSDFVTYATSKRNTIILAYGPGGVGKSHFGLFHAREPIVQINFDGRDREVRRKAVDAGRKIMWLDVPVPPKISGVSHADVKKLATSIVRRVTDNIEAACEASLRGNVGTIQLDTATELDQILTLAAYGSPEVVMDDYGRAAGRIKDEWWNILRMVRQSNANLILLAREKKIYRDKQDTGKLTYKAPTTLYDAADIAMEVRLKTVVARREKQTVAEFEITKAGNNRPLLWTTWTEEELGDNPFVFLCSLLTPGSTEEDWS
jgi:hypothetical protein